MKKLIVLVALLCTVMISSTAAAARGVVAFYGKSSRKIIIATNNGYTCGDVSIIGGWTFGLKRGNIVVGELHSLGTHDLYDLTTDSGFTVWIRKCWASEDDALDWLERGY